MVECIEYQVQQGDTLSAIAKTHYGEFRYYKTLAKFNEIENPDLIRVGQIIRVPKMIYTVDTVKIIREDDKEIVCIKAPVKTVEGAILFYIPEENCYVSIDGALKQRYKDSVKKCNDLAQEINDHLSMCAAASSKEDRDKLAKKGLELQEKAEKFAGPSKSPSDMIKEIVSLTPMNSGSRKVVGNINYLEDDFVKELAAKKIRGDDPEIKKRIKKLIKDAKPGVAAKASTWQSDQIEKDWPDIWNYKGKHEVSSGDVGSNFGYSAEAQWLRFVAGASLDTEFNLTERTIKFGGQGSIEYILGKGEVSGSLYLPDSDGLNIFNFFAISENARRIIQNEHVILRFRAEYKVKGIAYVGAAASAVVALPSIQLTDEAQEAKVEASASIGATASAGGEISTMMQWNDTADINSFKDLTKVFAMAEGSIGAAAEGTICCGYLIDKETGKGVFRFSIGAKVVAGLGGKLATGFDLGLEAGAELIAHILYLIKSHKLTALAPEAYKAACLYTFSAAVALGRGAQWAAEGIFDKFTDAAGALRELGEDVYDELVEFKGDFVTGAKRIQKEQQNPYMLATGLKVVIRRYENGDFDKILEILNQTRTDDDNHELKWMLRYISGLPDKGKAVTAGIEKLREFGEEQSQYHRAYLTELNSFIESRGVY